MFFFLVLIVCLVPEYPATNASATSPDNFTSNIFGGENANPRKYKFMVFVTDGTFVCGGSILDTKTVLTAAHCVCETPNLFVIAGASNPVGIVKNQTNITNEQFRVVERVIVYPGYNCSDSDKAQLIGDIAVLKLLEPFSFNKFVGDPVVIPNSELEKRAKRVGDCRRLGYGLKSKYPEVLPQRLQELFVKVRSISFCRKMWSEVGVSWNGKLLCTYNGFGKGTCGGDSGSPVVCFVNSRPIHMATHTFGTRSCVFGLNGAMRTLRYRTWIREQLNAA